MFEIEVTLDELAESFQTGMSANVEILGEKRDKAISIPLEGLQQARRRDGRLPPEVAPRAEAARDREGGPGGRNKFIWLSDHWKEYFDVVP